MPFDGSGFKPQTPYTSFVDGRSFPSMGMRDLYDTGRRSHDSMARSQEFARRSQESMTRAQQEADRFMRSMSQHAKQTQFSYSSPPLTLSSGPGGVGSAVGAVVRLAVLAVVVVYALPHVLRPTPPVILSARQFVTANLESAAAELMPSDVARSIDTFIGAISR
jgi:hypothetical protein